MTTNQIWYLRKRPVGKIADGDLELVEEEMPDLAPDMVRVRTIYLSLDPTNRIWMSDMDGYLPPVPIDDPMRGGGIGVVEESNFDEIPVGSLINTGLSTWSMYNDIPGGMANVLPSIPGVPLTAYMGPLGATGMTAYFGLTDIGKPKEGDTLVVSAAAGAVGSMVGQIGKIHGCHVVGIAGSDDKCKWLTEEAGFDAAINYKTEDVGAALDKHCPNGIDINFENVGGDIMDAAIARLNDFSRMPLCGLISTYNDTDGSPGPSNFANLLMRRTNLRGFIVLDYLDRFPEGAQAMAGWLMEGRIKYETDVVQGIENAPASLDRLFTGANLGKLAVQFGPEPD
ncbi:NADP-dependent oxidoreductase [Parasphingorhabdus litoris]|uniref:NADP-dependent oxidoreductase n=1 Tax=Parasphingorhabdus litoris TaxID=394733 RepID=A0ABN1B0N9_9SPHN|nr:NADP-dependent oxidoreductase [Parasphingorhabdus litoris]